MGSNKQSGLRRYLATDRYFETKLDRYLETERFPNNLSSFVMWHLPLFGDCREVGATHELYSLACI